MTPKKGFKKIYKKDIKKLGAICPSQIQKTKRKPTTFVVGFLLFKKVISDITLKQLE